MIDVSDGLASEIIHLCKQSGNGALIEEGKVPIHPMTEQTAIQFNLDPITCALHGGEDYELLFTVNPSDFEAIRYMPDVFVIGEMTEAKQESDWSLPADKLTTFQPRVGITSNRKHVCFLLVLVGCRMTYWLFLFVRLALHRQATDETKVNLPLSLVVAVKNNTEGIQQLVQRYKNKTMKTGKWLLFLTEKMKG